ncbi:methyltransferase [Vibrio scophthalmi]|uniref:tRNA1(Val) (adenine(37)-N6)-methyltransferase n=1 Tax=Vibrio scophthalmi TaxID=45658 RepID=UPI002FF1007C
MTIKATKAFSFKQFSIQSGQSGMPVSTDGVMLGAWAQIESARQILDIGTGTGLLALMCAQRNPDAQICAIDIDHHAICAAQSNFSASPWNSRLRLLQGDILSTELPGSFDAIICNPPYFTNGVSAKAPARAIARHADTLAHEPLLKRCQQLLAPLGTASFILPQVEGEAFIQLAQNMGWSLRRRCEVRTTANKPVSRLMFELQHTAEECQSQSLLIHDGAEYSEDFVALTRAFYLKMP